MKSFIFPLILVGLMNLITTTSGPVLAPETTASKECNVILSLVYVTVEVTFTDCPDYTCEAKDGCTLYICIYDDSYNLITCQLFNPEVCEYTFERIQAEEYDNIFAKIVAYPSCQYNFNTSFAGPGVVPPGGGTVEIDTHLCQ